MSQQPTNNEGKQPNKRRRQQLMQQQQQMKGIMPQQERQMKGIMPQQERNGIQSKPSKKRKQQGQPPRQNALFPNSYASFEEIPKDLRTGRNSYLIYFNTLNNTLWYYPSLNLDSKRIGPFDVLYDVEDFPYHPNFKYYYVKRNDFFQVTACPILNHEIDDILTPSALGPRTPGIKYTLNFSKVVGRYVSAWEYLNKIEPRPIYIERFLELLLPFEEEQRKRRQLQQQKKRQKQRQQQQRKNMQLQDRRPEPQQMQQIYPEQYQTDNTQQL